MSEAEPKPRPEVCVGAVVIADDRLLLIERGRGAAIGQWSVPGGRVEPGETIASAVEREVFEETGLAVQCGAIIGWVERISDEYHFVIMDFRAELKTGGSEATAAGPSSRPPAPDLVAGDDAAAAAWVPLGRLGEVDLVDGLLDFLVEHGIVSR